LKGQQADVEHVEMQPPRLYRKVAARLMQEVREGRYPVGARMPAERELAVTMGVSRPVVREALLALEVMGVVEVRIGSGAYVLRQPDEAPSSPAADVTPMELAQARLIFEGEAASLAAANITDEDIAVLRRAIVEMGRHDGSFEDWQAALTDFHMTVARATHNVAVERGVRDLWEMRSRSPECRRMLEEARARNYRYSLEQHVEIAAALEARDPVRARAAVRMHLEGSIEHLLMAIEERAVAEARARVAEMRSRYFSR
jgi:DNA-binding FadR family transcriptional regulator